MHRLIGFVGLIMMITACSITPVDEEETSEGIEVTVVPRTDENLHLAYPLTLFIQNNAARSVEQLNVAEENLPVQLSLPAADYTFTLCSGISNGDYLLSDGLLVLKEGCCSSVPLIRGVADVNLREKTEVNIPLSPGVAALSFAFSGLPAGTESVSVQVSPVSSSLSLGGAYANDSKTCTVSCSEAEGVWTSPTVYVFPVDETTRTRLSISVQADGESEVYSYTYKKPLEAGLPFRFSGNLQHGVEGGGDAEISGWKPVVDVVVDFTEADNPNEEDPPGSEEENPGGENDLETLYATEMPVSECIWGPFFVWKTETVTEGEELIATLVSPAQWYLLAEEALIVLSDYEEEGLTGWRTFTRGEACEFRDQYYKSVSELNKLLTPYGLTGFSTIEKSRYLCADADSTFSFQNTRVIEAGKTVKYYLRGIKKVRVIQK